MSETNKPGETTTPAKVPPSHRKPGPPPRWPLKELEAGGACHVPRTAIYIDQDWGVWIDPNCPITEADLTPHNARPALVRRTTTGWHVDLRESAKREGLFENSADQGAPDGFIPAEVVF